MAAENLSAYIDGELTAAERARLERHLAECAGCRRDVETLQETVALLRRVALKPVPRSFALPASARGAQARHRRWSTAFGAMRTATVTIASLLVLVFAGDAALTTGLVSLPNGRTAGERAALMAPDEGPAPAEASPMLAQGAPEAEGEAGVEAYAETEAAPAAESPAPSETARALQPSRETWPGPKGQPGGAGGAEGGEAPAGGGMGGAGGSDIPVPSLSRPNGVDTDTPQPEAAPPAEAQVESLTQGAEVTATPSPDAGLAPKLAPTPAPEPTETPAPAPTAMAAPTATAEPPTPEALAMQAAPDEGGGGPSAESERVMPLDRRPETAWWKAWRSLRVLVGLLAGLLLIALAGTIWTGYKRGTL